MSSKFKSHDVSPKPATPAKPTKVALKPVKEAGKTEEKPEKVPEKVEEIGGPSGPEPTRYGDWEVNGRCVDF